ncbi:GlxA family transcriptional regulator [Undibacterium sp. SXout7W]|uniref:GlxA family transcriptional regulator n=1 Tax=Undibacterium sp. SXout7W TaxID=3413049 RepID=UPI003BF0D488
MAMKIQTIYFLLLPDTLLLDLAGPADAFLFANRYQDNVRFRLAFISPLPDVTCSAGLQLGPLLPLPTFMEDDAILVLPGLVGQHLNYNSPAEQQAIIWLRSQYQSQRQSQHRLICICSGALLAAHAGLLRNHHATTHHDHCQDLSQIDSSIYVEENRIFVEDGKISTSAGVTAGIDLVLHLISDLADPLTAASVARNMVVYMRRSGHDPQLSPWLQHRNHLHPAIHKVQNAILKNPAQSWNLSNLSEIACTSSRHLTRLFKLHSGISIQEYLTGLRLSLAKQLLTETTLPIDYVAQKAGFGSTRQFRRVWNAIYPFPPSAAAKQMR